MHKKLLLLSMLLSSCSAVLVGMDEKKQDWQLCLMPLNADLTYKMVNYLPVKDVVCMGQVNKSWQDKIDCIITDVASAAHVELKKHYNMCTTVLSHYAITGVATKTWSDVR